MPPPVGTWLLYTDRRHSVALAQAHLHSLGVLHSDIKASNVLLQPNARHALGHAVLSDFGVAAPVGTQREDHTCGTTRYMAPEVRGALLSLHSLLAKPAHPMRSTMLAAMTARAGGGFL